MALLSGAGCGKEELPPPVTEPPVFTLDLTWEDGTAFQPAAGEDRYYLKSGLESDSLDVYSFYGRFEQLDCLNECGPSFAIFLRDDKTTPAGAPGMPQFQANGSAYSFFRPVVAQYDTLTQYRVHFESNADPAIAHFWTLGDSTTSILPDPEIVVPSPDQIPACLMLGNPVGGCYSENCQTAWLDNTPAFSATVQSDSNSFVLTAVPIGGQAPYTYLWDNGSQGPVIQVFFPGETHCVTVTDSEGKQASICVQAAAPGTTMCVAGFTYQHQVETQIITLPGDSLQFGSIILEYVDEDGVHYRSDRMEQAPGAYFFIDEVNAYEPNENGLQTLQVKARFSGSLLGENGVVKKVQEAIVVFAVAYQ